MSVVDDWDGWEARMSARAHARGAAGMRHHDGRKLEEIPGPHDGHEDHYCHGAIRCSCGVILGVTSYVIPEGDWIPEPCPVCGDPP